VERSREQTNSSYIAFHTNASRVTQPVRVEQRRSHTFHVVALRITGTYIYEDVYSFADRSKGRSLGLWSEILSRQFKIFIMWCLNCGTKIDSSGDSDATDVFREC
jgi:hypothetical protein